MKKIYNLSRIILTIMTFIIFNIMFINEDSSWMKATIIFSIVTFIFSFPSTIVSKKMISIGNKINNKILKVIYYIVLPIILIIISGLIGAGISMISSLIPTENTLSSALSHALMTLFIITIIFIGIILPYIQSIIVLILKKIFKISSEES